MNFSNLFKCKSKPASPADRLGADAHCAAGHGDWLAALALIKEGADVNYVHSWRGSYYDDTWGGMESWEARGNIAHHAIIQGNTKALAALLEQGLNPNLRADDERDELLLYAIKNKQSDAARLLIENGANVSQPLKDLSTAADLARKYGLSEIAELIELKRKTNQPALKTREPR